jgi:hypothetical protein
MRQVWHIFWKDVRHLWREGAVSIVLMAAFAWYEVRGWAHEGDLATGGSVVGFFFFRSLSRFLVALVPISWSFLVVRAIQGESLVGDRQFWLTRPYEWKKLLAAKVLFVLIFVNLPLLMVDVFLLAKSGFAPTAYVLGLLWMQLLILLVLLLPTAALAAVTATVAQVLLALLAIVLYLIGMVVLSEQIPDAGFGVSSPIDFLTPTLAIGTPVAVLLLQYARRQTAKSRWLIAGLGGAILLILVATPYPSLVAREYPQLEASQQPLRLELRPVETPVTKEDFYDENEVTIQIPLNVSGMASDSIVTVSGVMATIEGSDGSRWNSGWQVNGTSLYPDQSQTEIFFRVKKKLYDRMRMSPSNIRLSLAFTVFRDQEQREFVTPAGDFAMPDVGLCSVRHGYIDAIHCRSALRRPSSLLVTTDVSATSCPATEPGEAVAAPGTLAHEWFSNSESTAELGISPVQSFDLYLSVDDRYGDAGRKMRGVCPGTRLILSKPELVRRGRVELQFNGIRLLDYRRGVGRIAFRSGL